MDLMKYPFSGDRGFTAEAAGEVLRTPINAKGYRYYLRLQAEAKRKEA
jgi:hypothetical protein|tara:strand:- start:134 stop:277 length:144 start_codon:yes stop_codon:yes gene_type:complete